MRVPWFALEWVVLIALLLHPVRATSSDLVLLTDTGEERDGLPVLAIDDHAHEVADALRRGLSGTLLRVYQLSQIYLQLKEGIAPEPAYVLLSERQGGFARVGFVLGAEKKRTTSYLDVHRDWPATGRFGALDQIVPHELAHVLRRQLAGPLTEGNANQVHALGVRTDRATAFNEGFAEHLQAIAIDHPDADPKTKALGQARERWAGVERHLAHYRRELEARIAIVPRMRLGFLAWFSNDEDVLRYFAVKRNAYAHPPNLPERLLESDDPYEAYLLENMLPGDPKQHPWSLSRLVASEAVVSSFFYRWASSTALRESVRDRSFYELFGVDGAQISPLENVYLKIVHVLWLHKPQDVISLARSYQETFPDEAPAVAELMTEVFFNATPELAPEIWLANPSFATGTTLFDQYRGLAREHTFDLNGASLVDLASVPGVGVELAQRIQSSAPFGSIDGLGQVSGIDSELLDRFRHMSREMQRLRDEAEATSAEELISIGTILRPYVWRALGAALLSALAATLLYRGVRARPRTAGGPSDRPAWWRCICNGVAASAIGLVGGWSTPSAGIGSVVAVVLLLGVPATLWHLRSTHSRRSSLYLLLAWATAALPAAFAVTPWL